MKLRTYQREAISAIREKFREHQSTLLVSPTGSGKTVVAASLMSDQAGRTLFLVHRDELGDQAMRTARALGIEVDREQGYQWAEENPIFGEKARVVVSTVQTQISGRTGNRRMDRFNPKEFSLLIADEGHHAPSKSWAKTIDYYRNGNPDLRVLGQTATPDRRDEKALGKIFESVAYVYEIEDAIRDGWLVDVRQERVFVDDLDLSRIRKTAGDLNGKELATVVEQEKNLLGVADAVYKIAGQRKTLIFCVTIDQAERLAEILNRHEAGCAGVVSQKTFREERKQIFRDFSDSKFRYLTNVGICTEGYDEPTIEVIAVARPTLSRALYAQMVGRGLRPLSGIVDAIPDDGDSQLLLPGPKPADRRREVIEKSEKPFCKVLDFAGNAGKHQLASCLDILGGKYDDEELELADRLAAKKGGERAPQEDLAEARRQIQERKQREQQRRAHVIADARFRTVEVDPFAAIGYSGNRTYGWDRGDAPTEKQLYLLSKFHVPTSGLTKGQASRLITECIERREKGKCSYAQAKVLLRFGYDPEMGFADAKRTLDSIFHGGSKPVPEPKALWDF